MQTDNNWQSKPYIINTETAYRAGIEAGKAEKFSTPLPQDNPSHSSHFEHDRTIYQAWEAGFIDAMEDRA